MKRIALVVAATAAVAAGLGSEVWPAEAGRITAARVGLRAWDGVEANPVPVAVAVGTFLLTVGLRPGRGKAAGPAAAPAAGEPPVVRRAKARATRAQLIADQIGLQNRHRKLPDAVAKAEKDACYTEQGVADAERVLADRRAAHAAAVDRLDGLADEQQAVAAELAAIDAELTKLAELV